MEKISIVIPCHNDERHVWKLYEDISRILKELSVTYELIFIDNGSRDETLLLLRELVKRDYNCNYLSLSRNVSRMEAVFLGAKLATGEYIGFIDSRYPPILLSQFYQTIKDTPCACVGGSLQRAGHKSKPQTYFKMMKTEYLRVPLSTDNITQFCDRFYHNHSKDIVWIPYTELEHAEVPFPHAIPLFQVCSRSCLYLLMFLIILCEFILPKLFLQYDIAMLHAYIVSNSILILLLIGLVWYKKYHHPQPHPDNIRETTYL